MPRQAVLLIHGIGEQRPMDSLRSFVETVWTNDRNLHRDHPQAAAVWSKPYPLSENFELRRLTTAENLRGWRTDFFEFYWAHLVHGTKLRHVTGWVRTLLLRRPSTVPRHLRLAYWVLIALMIFGAGMLYRSAVAERAGLLLPVWASLVMGLLVGPAVVGILANIVGDAARYLHVSPQNVQRRHKIRAAGVEVLKSLHERGYDRIIVVGHSLGTVIGYDILNYAWTEYNTDAPTADGGEFNALTELEALAAAGEDDDSIETARIQVAQRSYFNELKSNGSRWRVTDFVTLGSPLAHSEILLAHDAADLKPKITRREFPRCPPELERSTRKLSMGLLATEKGIVTNVIQGSESWQAGLRPGMELMTVNGRRYSRQRLREAIRTAAMGGGSIELLAKSDGVETRLNLECKNGGDLAMHEKGVELRRFSFPPDAVQRVPHHAAVFGPTRWTNLYFPSKLLLWGDLVGGELRSIFGPGVRDIPVSTRKWLGFLSHTLYWTSDGKDLHVAKLRTALDLGDSRNGIPEN
jgi:hypothetical protein